MFLFFSGSKTDIGFVLRALVSGFAEIFTKIGSWQGDVASFFLQRKKGDCEDNCEGTQERLHKKLGQWYRMLCSAGESTETQLNFWCIFMQIHLVLYVCFAETC